LGSTYARLRAETLRDMGRHAQARPRRSTWRPTIVESQEHVDADAPEGKAKGARTRRKASAKASMEAGGKRSLNLRIDEDSYRRLSIHALMKGKTMSDLVMEFAQGHLREFSMPHRLGARTEQGE
jgi:hypothetical protein